jgi:hypothetical protein
MQVVKNIVYNLTTNLFLMFFPNLSRIVWMDNPLYVIVTIQNV